MPQETSGPRIRVVTVVRNDLTGLRDTLSSVEGQSSPPAQHVIQDGASTDGTTQWLDALPAARGRIIRSEEDAGIYDGMNRALRVDGEWDLVLFLNAGDRFASTDVLQAIADSWRNDRWGWAYGKVRLLRADGRVVRVHELSLFGWPRFISGIRSIPHQGVVLTRTMIETVGLHRLDLGLSADQEHLLRCWLRSRPVRLPLVVADCDASGVSAQQEAGAFAKQMRRHRRALGHTILGSRAVDRAVTWWSVRWDASKRLCGRHLRALRA